MIEHGFRRLGLPAIFAIVHEDNAASMRVASCAVITRGPAGLAVLLPATSPFACLSAAGAAFGRS